MAIVPNAPIASAICSNASSSSPTPAGISIHPSSCSDDDSASALGPWNVTPSWKEWDRTSSFISRAGYESRHAAVSSPPFFAPSGRGKSHSAPLFCASCADCSASADPPTSPDSLAWYPSRSAIGTATIFLIETSLANHLLVSSDTPSEARSARHRTASDRVVSFLPGFASTGASTHGDSDSHLAHSSSIRSVS